MNLTERALQNLCCWDRSTLGKVDQYCAEEASHYFVTPKAPSSIYAFCPEHRELIYELKRTHSLSYIEVSREEAIIKTVMWS